MRILLALCLLVLASKASADSKPIFDPFFVFCGEANCYDILGVQRSDNITTISKAYRQLSKTVHPDKVHPDKKMNVTEQFRLISKAYEVLKGNESRPNFDFYLDNPRSYFKATGKHAWRALPKVHPIFVILFSMLAMSGFLHYIQITKHERAARLLKEQVKAGLNPAKGGSKLSVELHHEAVRVYEAYCKSTGVKLSGNLFTSPGARELMREDPKFDEICGAVLSKVKDWGEYAQPDWRKDLFIIKAFTEYPFTLVSSLSTFYRRYLSGADLTEEDKYAMARTLIGPALWESMSSAERDVAVRDKLYESEHYDRWLLKREDGSQEMSKRQQKLQKKAKRFGREPMQVPMQMPEGMRDLTE